jgi:glycosyltransferase involved in cell wall biosynthesis
MPDPTQPNYSPFVFDFAENLARFGFNVSIIGPMRGNDNSATKTELLTIYRVNERFPITSMLRLVSRINPDVIHVHAPNFFSCYIIPVAKLKRIPIVATVHLEEVDPVGYLLSAFRKLALARFDKVIAVSNYTRSLALNAGVKGDKISVIYNSCDETFFGQSKNKDAIRKKYNIPMDIKVIIFVGQLINRKGVSFLIESLRILRKTVDNFLTIIVGQGEEFQKLKSLVKEYGLVNHVDFRGNVTRKMLAELYSVADVFVLPSLAEGHSVALVEAMASGLPLIASDIEGSRVSIKEEVNGYLIDIGNVQKLAQRLKIILTDSNLQQKMSRNSSKIYGEKFSTKILIDNYLEIYKSVIKNQ